MPLAQSLGMAMSDGRLEVGYDEDTGARSLVRRARPELSSSLKVGRSGLAARVLASVGLGRASGFPVTAGRTSIADQRTRFWKSYVSLGFSLLVLESLVTVVYLLMTPDGSHRAVLFAIGCGSGVAAVAGWCLSAWVAEQPWRSRFSLAWSLMTGVALAGCAHLDGGLDSPFLYLLILPVMYAAMALMPRLVALVGAAALVELVVIRLTDVDVRLPMERTLMLSALVVGAALLAFVSAVQRSRLEFEEAELSQELRRLADIDGLTGCWNHRTFYEHLDHEVDRALRYRRPLSLLLCDVDLFKGFNDAHGHAAGDVALVAVGATLRSEARSSDGVGRIGGDEFALLMPETTKAQAVAVAQRIISPRAMVVTLSIGVAALNPVEPTSLRLFRDADAALYDAKEQGRHTVVVTMPPSTVSPSTETEPSRGQDRSDVGIADRVRT
jgi:diguanylate cyclase (GGDEF)-like protein